VAAALLALLASRSRSAATCCSSEGAQRQAAAFASPALVPNLVGRSPGRLRHLAPALALLALAALATGSPARTRPSRWKREEATVVLAIDTSRSMVATDVPPSRLAVAQQARAASSASLPKGYRVGMVSFAQAASTVLPATANREAAQAALRNLRTGDGTALGEGIARAIQVAQRVPRRRAEAAGVDPRPLDGAQTQGVLEPQAARCARRS
jgi:Ca-activated chloride channel family protein